MARRHNPRRVYGTPYQDPAGSEMHEEADDGFNRWHRNKAIAKGLSPPGQRRRRRKTSVRPAWMGGPGVKAKFPVN